jgi:hypothetical protein
MKTVIVAAALAAFALPAFAGAPWTAIPVQASTKTAIVAGSVIWDCNASGCHTTSDTAAADSLSACRGLAKEVGELTTFSSDGQAYAAARMARCNAVAPKAKS